MKRSGNLFDDDEKLIYWIISIGNGKMYYAGGLARITEGETDNYAITSDKRYAAPLDIEDVAKQLAQSFGGTAIKVIATYLDYEKQKQRFEAYSSSEQEALQRADRDVFFSSVNEQLKEQDPARYAAAHAHLQDILKKYSQKQCEKLFEIVWKENTLYFLHLPSDLIDFHQAHLWCALKERLRFQ